MARLRLIQVWIPQYFLWILGILAINMVCIKLQAQAKYDIKLSAQYHQVEASNICFEVQLRSADAENWELAGQNYRLFYDASQAEFISGKSLLGNKYQAFKLVQDAQHIDASEVGGNLAFEKDLGFLNYAIDLLDPTQPGSPVPADGTWLTTSEICFQVDNLADSLKDFSLIWARNGMTEAYATSFVEISNRVGTNLLEASSGENYEDFSPKTTSISTNIQLKAKVFLQAIFDTKTGLMHDVLRTKGYIPLETPYSSSPFKEKKSFKMVNNEKEVVNQEIFNMEGTDAIIDWVFLELRDQQDNGKVVATRSALLQRDGDIVDIDGKSAVSFPVPSNAYYVVIRHRNHLGIMSKYPIDFKQHPIVIDYTNPETPVYGEYAQKEIGAMNMLWGGNADNDGYLIFQGAGVGIPDSDKVFFDVFADKKNVHGRYNHIVKGYLNSDLNMDGEVKYQGGNNEIDELLFFNIFSYPQNTDFHSNFFIPEWIPIKSE